MEISFMVTTPAAIRDFHTLAAARTNFERTPAANLWMVFFERDHPSTIAHRELLETKI